MSVNERNIKAILQHGNATRELIRVLEDKVNRLEQTNKSLSDSVLVLTSQVQTLQVKVYSGGATSGNND